MTGPEDFFKGMMEALSNPLFRAGFMEYAQKAQLEGLEAAKRFWNVSDYSKVSPYSVDMLEKLNDWYRLMGYVPAFQYQKLEEENTRLKAENESLKSLIQEMQLQFFTQGGENAKALWQDMLDNQLKLNTAVANSFFEALGKIKPGE